MMGSASSYHPGWVYHGLLVGSVRDAAALLDRIMNGALLPAETLRMMLETFALPGPVPDRPWRRPGYGLGVMAGETTAGQEVAGHTGGGPGSTIAVYHSCSRRKRSLTVGFFAVGDDQARTEEWAFRFLRE